MSQRSAKLWGGKTTLTETIPVILFFWNSNPNPPIKANITLRITKHLDYPPVPGNYVYDTECYFSTANNQTIVQGDWAISLGSISMKHRMVLGINILQKPPKITATISEKASKYIYDKYGQKAMTNFSFPNKVETVKQPFNLDTQESQSVSFNCLQLPLINTPPGGLVRPALSITYGYGTCCLYIHNDSGQQLCLDPEKLIGDTLYISFKDIGKYGANVIVTAYGPGIHWLPPTSSSKILQFPLP